MRSYLTLLTLMLFVPSCTVEGTVEQRKRIIESANTQGACTWGASDPELKEIEVSCPEMKIKKAVEFNTALCRKLEEAGIETMTIRAAKASRVCDITDCEKGPRGFSAPCE